MSDPGGRGPDWSAVFNRAHRRIARRLLLLGAIGAVGALFLLSGGLTASGAISWHLRPTRHETKRIHRHHRHHRLRERQERHRERAQEGRRHRNRHRRKQSIEHHEQQPDCATGTGFSSQLEYEERCWPEATESEDGGEEGAEPPPTTPAPTR
jgi:hypothetical protein